VSGATIHLAGGVWPVVDTASPLDRRRRLMADWAAFLAKPAAKGNATPIRGFAHG
jgi:hypothetical protein